MDSANTVAVVVPSPAMSEVFSATSLTIWSPHFSNGSSNSISLATETPSLVTVGDPNFLSKTTLRPRGPKVILTARDNCSTPRKILRRASSSNINCLAPILLPPVILFYNSQNVFFLHDQKLFTFGGGDLCAAVLGEQDAVPH